MYANTFQIKNVFLGTASVTVAADGSVAFAPSPADATLSPENAGPAGVPTVPSGQVGLLIDTTPGSSITEPDSYGAIFDAASGSTTVTASPAQVQRILLSAVIGAGPAVFSEAGGSGTVYAGGVGVFDGAQISNNGIGSQFTFTGGNYTLDANNALDTVLAAGGTGLIEIAGGQNRISLADGIYTVLAGVGGPGNFGADTIAAGAGTYAINANESASSVFLGGGTYDVTLSGASTLFGGAGDITLSDLHAGSVIENGAGNLVATFGTQFPSVTDSPHIGLPGETVFGGAGSVSVSGPEPDFAALLLQNGTGLTTTTLSVEAADDLLIGGTAGHNMIFARSFGTTIFGGGDGDVLLAWGNPFGGDTIVAGPGAESLFGNGTEASQYQPRSAGPPGGNLLVGGSGPDLIVGSPGHDSIIAGSGADTIATGIGGSIVQLGTGRDLVNLSGTDTVFGGTGTATVSAAGRTIMFGGTGSSTFLNGAAASTVVGGGGSQTLYAGAGGGVFVGGAGGGNLLAGGSGLSLMYGGTGAGNVFQFDSGTGGADLIGDFDPARDRVALAGFAPGTAASVLAAATVANGSTTIVLPDSTQVTFYQVAALNVGDFTAG